MPEKTMREAAEELHAAVIALKELLEREYPSRREVERRFVSKHGSNRRWVAVLVLILTSAFLSFLGTVGTVSTCFLGDQHHPSICNALPGYQSAAEQNEELVAIFKKLVKTTTRNDKRLDKLEKEAGRD